jgi:hypothetical protein
MALTSKRRYPNVGTRRKVGLIGQAAQLPRRTPIGISNCVPGASTVVTFDQAGLVLNGIPQWPDNTGAMPTAAELTGPDELTLTYAAPVPTAVTVPFEDPGIRNGAGGYVSPGTFS